MINFDAFYKLSYGMFVVTAGTEDQPVGYIANTAFQVTAEPSQLAISCHKNNHTANFLVEGGAFCVSVLQQNAEISLIQKFGYSSGRDKDKFSGVMYKAGQTGVPVVLDDTIAYFECRIAQKIDTGTHWLIIGEVVNAELVNKYADPMTYAWYREVKKGLSPPNAPTYIDQSKVEKHSEESASTGTYLCTGCGYVYDPVAGDPDGGIPPGTPFEDIPDDWVCPVCGISKESFIKC